MGQNVNCKMCLLPFEEQGQLILMLRPSRLKRNKDVKKDNLTF